MQLVQNYKVKMLWTHQHPQASTLAHPRARYQLNGQGHHVHEARVVKIHEAFEATIIISDIEPCRGLYHTSTSKMT